MTITPDINAVIAAARVGIDDERAAMRAEELAAMQLYDDVVRYARENGPVDRDVLNVTLESIDDKMAQLCARDRPWVGLPPVFDRHASRKSHDSNGLRIL